MQRAKPALLVERIHLDHDPVDLVVELRAPRLPLGGRLRDLLDGVEALRVRVRAEAVRLQPLEDVPLAIEGDAVDVATP